MNNNDAWMLVESQERLLRSLVSRVQLPSGVCRSDVLGEVRLIVFEAICRSYDASKINPSTFVGRVFSRRIERVLKRLRPSFEKLSVDPIMPARDGRLECLTELGDTESLTEIESFAIGHLKRFGRISIADLVRRFPGEFTLRPNSYKDGYVDRLLEGLREKVS